MAFGSGLIGYCENMDYEENDVYYSYSTTQSNTTSLIIDLNTMLRNTSIEADLSGVLDKYQENLKESEVFLSNGIVNINFSEAALFLQSVSTLYGKKVDLLWAKTLDCQKRMIEFEAECRRKKEEVGAVSVKRKHVEEKEVENNKVSKMHSFSAELKRQGQFWDKVNMYMTLVKEKSKETMFASNLNHVRNDKWKRINQQRTQSSLNVDLRDYHVSEPHFLVDQEIIGDSELLTKLNELSMCELVNTMSSDEKHFKVKYLCQKLDQISCYYENDNYLTQYLKQKKLKISDLNKDGLCEYKEFVLKCQQDKNVNRAERITEITRGKSRISDAISYTDSAFQERSSFSDSYPASVASRRKSDSLFSDGILREVGVKGEILNPDSVSEENNISVASEHSYCISGAVEQMTIDDANNNITSGSYCDPECKVEDTHQTSTMPTTLSDNETNSDFILPMHTSKEFIAKKRKSSEDINKQDSNKKSRIEEKETPKPRKPRRVNLFKLIKIKATSALKTFEKFYSLNYEKQDGESGAEFDLEDDDCFDFEEEMCNSLNLDNTQSMVDSDMNMLKDISDNGVFVGSNLSNSEHNVNNVIHNENVAESNSTNVQEDASTNVISNKTATNEYSAMKAKSQMEVQQWQVFMRDKLKTIEQKSDFDIHSYSTTIIESIPLNECKKFDKIVGGLTAAEVSRHFLATLSLACTNNVEILGVEQGKVSNNTLELKLLSKTRHHEELEHYLPPSDEIRSKLQNVQMTNSNVLTKSYPSTSKRKNKRMKLS